MSATIVEKLFQSFDELEKSISVTRSVLLDKPGVPDDVLKRVEQYGDIVARQRDFAAKLSDSIAKQDWAEVTRYVRLINGLSVMIRDDAQAILAGAYTSKEGGPKVEDLLS